VFSTIQSPMVPNEKSAPNSILILIVFTITGGVLAIFYIFIIEFLKGAKKLWNFTEK